MCKGKRQVQLVLLYVRLSESPLEFKMHPFEDRQQKAEMSNLVNLPSNNIRNVLH